jgi:very-short-patch-repair endonuclease
MDFYCSDARLVIEVDGMAHDMGDNPACDLNRDAWLRSKGIDTVRIPAAEVLKDVASVADGVVRLALSRLPLHHSASLDGPPPRDKLGEDFRKPT